MTLQKQYLRSQERAKKHREEKAKAAAQTGTGSAVAPPNSLRITSCRKRGASRRLFTVRTVAFARKFVSSRSPSKGREAGFPLVLEVGMVEGTRFVRSIRCFPGSNQGGRMSCYDPGSFCFDHGK